MRTFREIYCERHRLPPEKFCRHVFWRCLYPHARFFVPFVFIFNRRFFAPDNALIQCAARALTMKSVREDVRDFYWDSNNRGWLRETLRIRVSGQRVKDLARQYVPEGESAIPFPPRVTGV